MPFLSPRDVKTIGALSTVGLSFVIAIALGVAGGVALDNWLGTRPWFFFAGFLVGLVAGVLNVIRAGRQAMARD